MWKITKTIKIQKTINPLVKAIANAGERHLRTQYGSGYVNGYMRLAGDELLRDGVIREDEKLEQVRGLCSILGIEYLISVADQSDVFKRGMKHGLIEFFTGHDGYGLPTFTYYLQSGEITDPSSPRIWRSDSLDGESP